MDHSSLNHEALRGLRVLRRRIAQANVPGSVLDETLNLATWNIREFGRRRRLRQSLHYIAEIINCFSIVAITEVRRNIDELGYVMELLGPYWRVIYSDEVADAGGNKERVAYLYDGRAVTFTGLAAEADEPRTKNRETGEYESDFSWWRKPYIASFRAGQFDFVLITAHIRWGKSLAERRGALERLASWVDTFTTAKHAIDRDVIVMGDFNIPKVGDSLYRAITSKGLSAPEGILGMTHGTNLARNKRYDQILAYQNHTTVFTRRGGAIDFYRSNHRTLYPGRTMTKREFTYELSDHLPLWVQLNTNQEDEKLDQLLAKKAPRTDS